MKTLTKYLNEKLVIFPSQVDEKSGINQQFDEKLVINKDYNDPYTCAPTSWEELRKIIKDRYYKLGPGTKQKPIDFNDVDVSNINLFYDKRTGLFYRTKFEYIDLSDWDVSNVKDMGAAFCDCYYLKSVGDLSNWNVSNAKDMGAMFGNCEQLASIGDLTDWNVSRVRDMSAMFFNCKQLKSVGDLSKWDVSNVKRMNFMFNNSGITNIPKWYKK